MIQCIVNGHTRVLQGKISLPEFLFGRHRKGCVLDPKAIALAQCLDFELKTQV